MAGPVVPVPVVVIMVGAMDAVGGAGMTGVIPRPGAKDIRKPLRLADESLSMRAS
jgi:hypothetical protein